MKRKIVQHGCSSLTVTLPVIWTKKFGIKKGDEVDVEAEDSSLIIKTQQEIPANKKIVDTEEGGIFTKNNLSHLYQLGYDEIEVRFDDEKTLQEIKDRVPECIGYEIIDQKENKVYIKSIATALETEFDVLLRKSFLITNEMAKAVLEAIKKQEFQKLREIRHQEFLNNKFTDCCIRILNKKGYKNPKRILQIYDIIENLERIADEYKYICDLLFEYKKPMPKELIDFFEQVNNYYYAFYNMFYKFSPDLKKTIYVDRKKLLNKGNELMEKLKGKETVLAHYLSSVVLKAYDAANSYFALMV